MTGDRLSPTFRFRAFLVGVPARELQAWFRAAGNLQNVDDKELRKVISAYRAHGITPTFIADLYETGGAYRFHVVQSYQEVIEYHNVLVREGIPAVYAHALMRAGIGPEDTIRFWEDAVPVEYALSLSR
jgi:hypothetical protein